MAELHPNPFPTGISIVAPDPSKLWDSSLKSPYPTNAPWQNFVLNKANSPEVVHPYLVKAEDRGLAVSYPNRGGDKNFIFQAFVPDVLIRTIEDLGSHRVSAYDDLSVTLKWGSGLTAPLVRGSPYVTCICHCITPSISTVHAVLNVSSNEDCTKHKVHFNNGQMWIIYASSALPLGADLQALHVFSGVLRIALSLSPSDEETLDKHSFCYPTGGSADFTTPYQVTYKWPTASWRPEPGTLVMLALPIHRQILADPTPGCGKLRYSTMDGHTEAVFGCQWTLKEPAELTTAWSEPGATLSPGTEAANEVAAAVAADVAALQPIANPSSYWAGKLLARAARLALIAEELGMETEKRRAVRVLRTGILEWFDGTHKGNGLIYDSKWGGIVSQDGARNAAADFGNGMYNDHHYHWGYFLYAGAVLAKMDPRWAASYKEHLYTLMYDIMNPGESPLFTRLRHFDPWVLHSWAGGLTEFGDGRNQESTSEAVNAYYAASLLGLVYGDRQLMSLACTLTLLECRAARTLWHVPSCSELYEKDFVKEQRIVGVLWANKVDSGLWFASREHHEMRTGIQIIPVTPILSTLFPDHEFVRELVEWTRPCVQRPEAEPGWKGFFYALQALIDKDCALEAARKLPGHDDGNSLSNTLWWIHTRRPCRPAHLRDETQAKLSSLTLDPTPSNSSHEPTKDTPYTPPTTFPPSVTFPPPQPTPDLLTGPTTQPAPPPPSPYSWATARPPNPPPPASHETAYHQSGANPFEIPPRNPNPYDAPPPPQTSDLYSVPPSKSDPALTPPPPPFFDLHNSPYPPPTKPAQDGPQLPSTNSEGGGHTPPRTDSSSGYTPHFPTIPQSAYQPPPTQTTSHTPPSSDLHQSTHSSPPTYPGYPPPTSDPPQSAHPPPTNPTHATRPSETHTAYPPPTNLAQSGSPSPLPSDSSSTYPPPTNLAHGSSLSSVPSGPTSTYPAPSTNPTQAGNPSSPPPSDPYSGYPPPPPFQQSPSDYSQMAYPPAPKPALDPSPLGGGPLSQSPQSTYPPKPSNPTQQSPIYPPPSDTHAGGYPPAQNPYELQQSSSVPPASEPPFSFYPQSSAYPPQTKPTPQTSTPSPSDAHTASGYASPPPPPKPYDSQQQSSATPSYEHPSSFPPQSAYPSPQTKPSQQQAPAYPPPSDTPASSYPSLPPNPYDPQQSAGKPPANEPPSSYLPPPPSSAPSGYSPNWPASTPASTPAAQPYAYPPSSAPSPSPSESTPPSYSYAYGYSAPYASSQYPQQGGGSAGGYYPPPNPTTAQQQPAYAYPQTAATNPPTAYPPQYPTTNPSAHTSQASSSSYATPQAYNAPGASSPYGVPPASHAPPSQNTPSSAYGSSGSAPPAYGQAPSSYKPESTQYPSGAGGQYSYPGQSAAPHEQQSPYSAPPSQTAHGAGGGYGYPTPPAPSSGGGAQYPPQAPPPSAQSSAIPVAQPAVQQWAGYSYPQQQQQQQPYGGYSAYPSYPQYPGGYPPPAPQPGYGYPPQQPYGAYPGYPPSQSSPYYPPY